MSEQLQHGRPGGVPQRVLLVEIVAAGNELVFGWTRYFDEARWNSIAKFVLYTGIQYGFALFTFGFLVGTVMGWIQLYPELSPEVMGDMAEMVAQILIESKWKP